MLVELAVGDAYGAGFEYVPDSVVRRDNNLSGYIRHKWHKLEPGCYTDDTQMSLAIAESLISGEAWTRENLAERFVHTFQRDPRKGYSRKRQELLEEVRDGSDFLARNRPHSDSSGAAMRAGPIGVLPDTQEVIERSRLQAAVTHDTPGGIQAAIAASLMSHYFVHEIGPKQELPDFVARHVPGPWSIPWQGEVGPKGMDSVSAALTSVMSGDSQSGILQAAVAFGGDTDTVATIALAAASCSAEIAADLPPVLIEKLENGPYGRDYIRDVDSRLTPLAK